MRRSVLTSLAVASLTLIAVPCSAQQQSPTAPTPVAQPLPFVRQEDCPKLIGEINAATNVRFDPVAANAKQVAADATKLQADGRYAECFAAVQPTRDLLILGPVTAAVSPDIDDPRLWAHPDE